MKIRKDVQALIFDIIDGVKKVFLIKFFDPTKDSYTWRLVKGGVEKGETDEQAMRREIEEEVTLRNVEVKEKVHNYEFIFMETRHMVNTYLVKGDAKEKPTLNWDGNRKIVDAGWYTPEKALTLLHWHNEKAAVKLLK